MSSFLSLFFGLDVIARDDHIRFSLFQTVQNIPFGKLVGIVFNCFVDFLGLNAVQFGHVGIQNHLLIPQGDHLVFYFNNVRHNTLFDD